MIQNKLKPARRALAELISRYVLPVHTPSEIESRIRKYARPGARPNPVKVNNLPFVFLLFLTPRPWTSDFVFDLVLFNVI